MFFALVVRAFIPRVISPNFFALSVLEIVFPFTLIASSILMNIDAISIGFVVEPFTFEHVSIDMPKLSVAASLIESPVAFVLGTVFPNLDSIAVLHVSEPLSSVSGSILEEDLSLLLELGFINIIHIEVWIAVDNHVAFSGGSIHSIIMIVLLESLMRIELLKMCADSFSSDNTARPTLQENDSSDVLHIVVFLLRSQASAMLKCYYLVTYLVVDGKNFVALTHVALTLRTVGTSIAHFEL